jgi:predicted metal-binding protein
MMNVYEWKKEVDYRLAENEFVSCAFCNYRRRAKKGKNLFRCKLVGYIISNDATCNQWKDYDPDCKYVTLDEIKKSLNWRLAARCQLCDHYDGVKRKCFYSLPFMTTSKNVCDKFKPKREKKK